MAVCEEFEGIGNGVKRVDFWNPAKNIFDIPGSEWDLLVTRTLKKIP